MTSINVAFMLPLGMGAAVSTMIGNSLGANKPDISRSIRNAAILGALLTVSSTCAFFMLVRNQWGSIFTGDQEVITIVSQILPIASVFQFFDGVNVVIGGLLRGTGHQKIGAVCNLVGYYVIGLPLAAFFAFELKLGLFGLWAGISIALLCVSGLSFFWIMTIDWKVECEKAAIRCEESVGLLVEGDP